MKELNDVFPFVKEEFLPRFISKFWISHYGKRVIELLEDFFNFFRKSIKEHQDRFDAECKFFSKSLESTVITCRRAGSLHKH